jgi:hypothetical protein
MKIKKIKKALAIFNKLYFDSQSSILFNCFFLDKFNKINNIVIKINTSAKNLENIIIVGMSK